MINLALLLLVAFMPFSTKLEGTYTTSSVVAAFYGANLALVNVLFQLLWWYACTGHRLVRPTLEPQVVAYIRLRGLLRLCLFLSSIGLAFLNAFLAPLAWLATFVVPVVLRRDGSPQGHERGSPAPTMNE